MQYQLKQNNETLNFISDNSLFEVNQQLKLGSNQILYFTYFSNDYSVDFVKQVITINGLEQDLKLPKNTEFARWINFRRMTVEFHKGIQVQKKPIYFIGFQVTINGVCYKRMIMVCGDDYKLVEES